MNEPSAVRFLIPSEESVKAAPSKQNCRSERSNLSEDPSEISVISNM